MAVCADYKISHSHFLGGPNRWTPADRDKAIWWYVREKERWGSGGTRKADWDADRLAYSPKKVRCRGCEVKTTAEKSISQADSRSVSIEMRPRERG